MTNEIGYTQQQVVDALAAAGIPGITPEAVTIDTASECEGSTMIMARVEQDVTRAELTAWAASTEAAKAAAQDSETNPFANFIVLEFDGLGHRDENVDKAKIRGRVSYIFGADAAEIAADMRGLVNDPIAMLLGSIMGEAVRDARQGGIPAELLEALLS